MKKISAYIHVPFCPAKCSYCDFLSFGGLKELQKPYTSALIREIEETANEFSGHMIDTIFIGGGTPTCLPVENLEAILDTIVRNYTVSEKVEITVEANPETVNRENLSALRNSYVNRLSIGAQSFDDKILARIGRVHNSEQIFKAFENAREAGFDNINLDIMFSLPEQSLGDLKKTLETAISLAPEHLSCYGLSIEEGSRFNKEEHLPEPDEETDRDMYTLVKGILEDAGYIRYEISNFAKPGKRCRHNMIYWTGGEYRGFGLGAHSMTFAGGASRYHNTYNMEKYLSGCGLFEDRESLTLKDSISEFMFLGLRLTDGINCSVFSKKFDQNIFRVFKEEIDLLTKQGLLCVQDDIIRLTDKGIDVSNYVFSKFI